MIASLPWLTLLVLLAGPWWPATAQTSWHVGVLGSANAGSVRYQPEAYHQGSVTPATRVGFAAGIGAWHLFAPHWAIQPSVRYVRSGFALEELVLDGTPQGVSISSYHTAFTRHQVEVPVQVNYYFSHAGRGFFLAGGCVVSALLAGSRTYDNLFTDNGVHPDVQVAGTDALRIGAVYPAPPYDGRYSLRRWDVSVLEGIGYQTTQFQAQLSGRVGVLNTATAPSLNSPAPRSYTYSAELQVGYYWP